MRPRRFTHRGSIEVVAYLVADRARVLALWEPGATVLAASVEFFVRLPRPRRIDAERAQAIPFTASRVLSSAPLGDDELASFEATDVVLVRAGEAKALSLGDPIDLSTWIDVEEWTVADAKSLGAAPPAAALVLAQPPATRSVFAKAVGAAPAEQASVIESLERRAEGVVKPSTLMHVAAFFSRILAKRLAAVPATPRGPSALDWALTRLNHLFARFLVATRLAQILGRRQAEYMAKLLEMFERGDLSEALRHAIPLGGEGSGPKRVALGVPSARRDLAIRTQREAASSVLGLGQDLFADLRKIYRAAFEKLEREGRIDEAAFVLVELLQADDEAIAFLERHGRLELAAEIAEARNMPIDLRVRLWFLAGDYKRAIALARAHKAFAGAIERLERANLYDPASALRMMWADSLADAGDYSGAVAALWPLEAARTVAERWIDLGIESGGVVAAELLGRKIALTPTGSDELRARVRSILESEDADAPTLRQIFGMALASEKPTPFGKVIARATVRALYGDAERDDGSLKALVRDVIEYADDAALRADRPTWPSATKARSHHVVLLHDVGTIPITDAALLPNGRTLVALGEHGVRVLTRAERVAAQFDQPADSLVVSDHGDRAIAIARRGGVSRLARINLTTLRSEPWCEARLAAFAPDFDGSLWFAGQDEESGVSGTTLVIDALASSFVAFRDLETSSPISIARSSTGLAIIAGEFFGTPERYTYDVTLQLRARSELKSGDGPSRFAVATDGAFAAVRIPTEPGHVATLYTASTGEGGIAIGGREWPTDLVTDARFIAVALGGVSGLRVLLLDRTNHRVVHELRLAGATKGGVRLQGDALLAWDDRGRVLAIDVATGRKLHDLRV